MGNLRKISIVRKNTDAAKEDQWLGIANEAMDEQYHKFNKARKTLMRNTIKKMKLTKEE